MNNTLIGAPEMMADHNDDDNMLYVWLLYLRLLACMVPVGCVLGRKGAAVVMFDCCVSPLLTKNMRSMLLNTHQYCFLAFLSVRWINTAGQRMEVGCWGKRDISDTHGSGVEQWIEVRTATIILG